MAQRARRGETNYAMFDRWSGAHAFLGGMLNIAGFSAGQALAVSVAWEVLEPGVKKTFPSMFPAQSLDTMANKVGDTASWMGGWLAAKVMTTPSSADFPPQKLEDGSVRISPKQAKLHKRTEGFALAVAVPTTLWVATRKRKLTNTEKLALGALAVGTVAVDGHLYARYRKAGV